MYRTHFLSKDLDKVAYHKKYSNTLNKLSSGPNLASTIHSSIKADAFLPATHSSIFFFPPWIKRKLS